jgi:Family of unknown function (DUF6338)
MPDFQEPDNLYLVLIFIVPGVVALFVRSRSTTGRSPSFKENLLSFLVLSLVYYSLIINFIEQALSVREPWLARAGVWILLILVGPAAFGLALGVAAQKDWGNWVANKFGVSFVHVIPAAWDWRFSKTPRNGMFIMVTLETGETVAGFFGTNSFASSDTAERDLYIEEEYTVTEEGAWETRPEKVGLLIPVKGIRYIEFWHPK